MTNADETAFVIHAAAGCGALEFFGLEKSREGTIEGFSVRFTDENLSAAVHVWADYSPSLPNYFADLAHNWQGWEGTKEWAALERELTLAATHDRRGHISIAVVMRGGPYPKDWTVKGTIPTEAGLLDRIASDSRVFA